VSDTDRAAQPAMFFEDALAALREAAEAVIADTPEIRGVSVAVDWRVPGDAIPAGFSVGRDGPVRHPDETLGAMAATRKLLILQTNTLAELFRRVEEYGADLARKVRAYEQRLAGPGHGSGGGGGGGPGDGGGPAAGGGPTPEPGPG